MLEEHEALQRLHASTVASLSEELERAEAKETHYVNT